MDEGIAATLTDPIKGSKEERVKRGRVKKERPLNGDGSDLGRAVSVRLEDGNFKGAVRLLTSDEVLAKASAKTLKVLQNKHPSTPSDRRPAPTTPTTQPMVFLEAAVRKAIFSFPPGSSGGMDGLTPQHLKDMVASERSAVGLLGAVTTFMNALAEGSIPDDMRPYFFGGRLIALNKKDGGIRPIAVGLCFRRLASKLVSAQATAQLAQTLSPLQVGVGISGGVEAAVHATCRFASAMTPSQALIKLDFANAFNSVRRDVILERTAALIPEAYPYIKAAYADSSFLGYEGEPIMSSEGVQQGDPLGPLLFCMAIHPLLTNIKCEFKMGYLDDITLGGELETVAKEVDILSKEAAHIGLTLRESKCELVTSTSLFSVPQPVKGYRRVPVTEAVMLGAPLIEGIAMDQIRDKH